MSSVLARRSSLLIFTIFCISLGIRIFFLNRHDLFTEEAYYWNYALHMDFGYLDHPPLVAALIKIFTTLLGDNEFAVRCPALLCWGIATYYIYRWSELVHVGSGQYSVLLLSILPFFFADSCLTTPDMPLMAAWAAALYFLYQALCLHKANAWYAVGISIGLGMLAKYSIALLIMSTGLFILINPEQRMWLRRKEPYFAAILIFLLFSPVIYWNATHNWMSFLFQTSNRLHDKFRFTLHILIGIYILFLTPIGIRDYVNLFKSKHYEGLSINTTKFIQTFILVPTAVFVFFSCFHRIKLDWIGPSLLALVPWSAYIMQQQISTRKYWLGTTFVLVLSYTYLLMGISYGNLININKKWLSPIIAVSWQKFSQDFYHIATLVKQDYPSQQPILLPLNMYRVESELTFYQNKQYQQQPNLKPFTVHHAAMFGINGLMFELWDKKDLHGKIVILMSDNKNMLNTDIIHAKTQALAPIQTMWTKSQNSNSEFFPYYYQVVKML
ncbi:MAG: glycosyltransferase family 39 protein [Gammaproteobacteria bacterium]